LVGSIYQVPVQLAMEEGYCVACVGIIANPSSGKDIRRLVAHGSVFNNNEMESR
jgi:hypothetical protein